MVNFISVFLLPVKYSNLRAFLGQNDLDLDHMTITGWSLPGKMVLEKEKSGKKM